MRMIMQYLWNMVPYCVFGLLAYAVIRVAFIHKKINWKREIVTGLFVAYCFGLASQTIIPHFNIGISSTTGKTFIDIFLNNDNASVNLTNIARIPLLQGVSSKKEERANVKSETSKKGMNCKRTLVL